MIKLSWGAKIASLYIGFVILIITMVTISMNQKIDLVSKDYYEQELAYQNKIDETNNANALSETVKYELQDAHIAFQFPKEFIEKKVSGNVFFFRPSDASKDYNQTIALNENAECFVKYSALSKGMYKVKISWSADNKNYYNEQIIVIP